MSRYMIYRYIAAALPEPFFFDNLNTVPDIIIFYIYTCTITVTIVYMYLVNALHSIKP